MRLAAISTDFWELRNGEVAHASAPDTFWLPPKDNRRSLVRGQAAKLIFDIEGVTEQGDVEVQGERMWVIVAERVEDLYIGILDNQPALLEPSEDTYLCFGAEIPFGPEHVIDIGSCQGL